MDDPDAFLQSLQQLAVKHHHEYNVKNQNFKEFKRGFMKAIKRKLVKTWCMGYDNAWEWFWNFVISVMSTGESMHINDKYKQIGCIE